jgi:hypothetical protein
MDVKGAYDILYISNFLKFFCAGSFFIFDLRWHNRSVVKNSGLLASAPFSGFDALRAFDSFPKSPDSAGLIYGDQTIPQLGSCAREGRKFANTETLLPRRIA